MRSSSMPMRNFTVTGTPAGVAARTAARTIEASNAGRAGMAAPPPLRVTLAAGQPKLMSTWSTPSSAVSRVTASPTSAGSTP